MKASELIAELEILLSQRGDLEVKFEDRSGYRYPMDSAKVKMQDSTTGTPEIVLSK